MDFNSLYPSIIQEYNICFTTVERQLSNEQHRGDEEEQVPEVPDGSVPLGIFPRLVQNLVQRRRAVKSNMKDPKATPVQLAQWDIKQQALKLTANSMYGCLGFTKSRFYARPLAVLTTFKGREILTNTKELAEANGLKVIYGDTDSVMINTNVDVYDEAIKTGNDFKRQVNERYRLLEIDIDNVFRRMLLHAKKKYAAVNMSVSKDGQIKTSIEVKGLDMKRREYCDLSKEASQYALNQILGDMPSEEALEHIHEYLRQLSTRLRENQCHWSSLSFETSWANTPRTTRKVTPCLMFRLQSDALKRVRLSRLMMSLHILLQRILFLRMILRVAQLLRASMLPTAHTHWLSLRPPPVDL